MRCHTASWKVSTKQHYGQTQLMWMILLSCWCTYNTLLHGKEPSSASETEERRITKTVYHSLRLCLKLSLCDAGWNPGISLEQGPVYHAFCVNIFQEGWCTSPHLTVHHFWWSGAWHLFYSEFLALTNTRYYVPVCRYWIIKSWCFTQLNSTANHP